MERERTYRILSLDGGGTWALVQIRALMRVFGEETTGLDVLRYFRLVVANSGGSTIVASLAVNQTLAQIERFLLDEKTRMPGFDPTCAERLGLTKVLPVPRYHTRAKRKSLERELGRDSTGKLTEWKAAAFPKAIDAAAPAADGRESGPDLLFPAFDYDTERGDFFRTDSASRATPGSSEISPDATLLDAVHASTTAPVVFFDQPARVRGPLGGSRYWDGAIAGYNNPVMAGVVEALANGARHGEIGVLSLGTGTVRRPRRPPGVSRCDPRFSKESAPGVARDLAKLASAVLDDPPDAASVTAHVVLGGAVPERGHVVSAGPVIRMSPVIRPEWHAERGDWEWPPALPKRTWETLVALQMDAKTDRELELLRELAEAWLDDGVPNQPIRAGRHLIAEIGRDRVGAALDEAKEWLFGSA